MTPKPISYNLKDFEIFHSSKLYDFSLWIPDKTYIVIGRSNTPKTSVHLAEAKKDKIQVLKRPSGGETVILSPKTLVIAVKIEAESTLNAHKYFAIINRQLITALEDLGISNLNRKGISDISIGEKKILGSSVYRKSKTVFYHAVLNVSESTARIETYLKHPKKEPDYRNGRTHGEFVTSLANEHYTLSIPAISQAVTSRLQQLPIDQNRHLQ